jgi:hypothetical protein
VGIRKPVQDDAQALPIAAVAPSQLVSEQRDAFAERVYFLFPFAPDRFDYLAGEDRVSGRIAEESLDATAACRIELTSGASDREIIVTTSCECGLPRARIRQPGPQFDLRSAPVTTSTVRRHGRGCRTSYGGKWN